MSKFNTPPQLFAIIPAAGKSRRMGTHKLLLSLGKETVIQRLVRALNASFVTKIIIVARKDDLLLKEHISGMNVQLIQPEIDPPDMKASVQIALDSINTHDRPVDEDGWLLIPADHPVLNGPLIASLYHVWENSNASILIPTFQGRKGHPAFFRWPVSKEVFQLREDQGINALWNNHSLQPELMECNHPEILIDLDTPEDYEYVKQQYSNEC
ncbi:MAG: nucleotidyltransferase family protein [Gimesia sp.]